MKSTKLTILKRQTQLIKFNNFSNLLNLLPLIKFYFSIQSNSAESERGFSKMNNIKTKNRNKMEIDTLDYLLRISSADELKLNEISDGCLYDRWKELKIRKSNLIKK